MGNTCLAYARELEIQRHYDVEQREACCSPTIRRLGRNNALFSLQLWVTMLRDEILVCYYVNTLTKPTPICHAAPQTCLSCLLEKETIIWSHCPGPLSLAVSHPPPHSLLSEFRRAQGPFKDLRWLWPGRWTPERMHQREFELWRWSMLLREAACVPLTTWYPSRLHPHWHIIRRAKSEGPLKTAGRSDNRPALSSSLKGQAVHH